ncbi:MAG: hypothetical protein ABIB71_04060 [Candidatus Woesearchaeota archaeon]
MYKIYGYFTGNGNLELGQYQEATKRLDAIELAKQFEGWTLQPVIIEWRKGWLQGKEISSGNGAGKLQ